MKNNQQKEKNCGNKNCGNKKAKNCGNKNNVKQNENE